MIDAKRPDRRVERTRRALLTAFGNLIRESGFERVTVRDIIERADVGRSTFYEHFDGKEDMLEQAIAPLVAVLADAATSRGSLAQIAGILAHFWQNRRLTCALLGGTSRRLVTRVLADGIEERLSKTRYDGTRGQAMLPQTLIAAHLAEAQMGVIEAWISERAQCTPEALARAIISSTRASLAALT